MVDMVDVQFVAEAENGRSVTEVKVPRGAALDRVMRAWCRQQEVPLEAARFEAHKREVRPEDSPQSLAWSAQGPFIIQVVPRAAVLSPAPAAPASGTKAAEVDPEVKIRVEMRAEGREKLAFRMSLGKRFEKAITGWCRRFDVASADFTFVHEGHRLQPTESPASLKWHAARGTFIIDVVSSGISAGSTSSRPAASPKKTTAEVESKSPARDRSANSASQTQVELAREGIDKLVKHKTMQLSGKKATELTPQKTVPVSKERVSNSASKKAAEPVGTNVAGLSTDEATELVDVCISSSAFRVSGWISVTESFGNLMQAWSRKSGEKATFSISGTDMKIGPGDTPQDCCWSAQQGQLAISADPCDPEPLVLERKRKVDKLEKRDALEPLGRWPTGRLKPGPFFKALSSESSSDSESSQTNQSSSPTNQ